MRFLLLVLCVLLTATSVADEPRLRIGQKPQRPAEIDDAPQAEFPPFDFRAPQATNEPKFAEPLENSKRTPIPLTRDPQSDSSKDGRSKSNQLAFSTLLTALSVVVLLLLGLAKLFSKRNPFAAPGIPREAIDVLGRRTVDPRSSIYVVRVGTKVLLLGSSTNGLTTLSEVTDPIEVATITNLCRGQEADQPTFADWCLSLIGRKPPRDTRSFGERFGESLFQDAERTGVPLTSLTVRPTREEQHVG